MDMNVNANVNWVIGLCDDAGEWYMYWKQVLSDFLAKEGETAELLYFPDAASLQANERKLDVLFLDICLDTDAETKPGPKSETDGIQLARQLDGRQGQCQIVYLTNFLSFAVDVYHTEHSYFVLKEQFEQRLGDIFQKLRAWRQQNVLCFSIINGGELILHPWEIHYFERVLHTTKIVTDSGTYLIRDKLDALEKMLPGPEMLRCHNSYMVNLTYVREMCKGYFLLKDQTMIQISRNYTRSVKESFIRWARRQVGGYE